MLEIDCHLTKDGKVVVVHDENLMRLTGHDIRVSATRYDELPPLQKIVPIDFDPGKLKENARSIT